MDDLNDPPSARLEGLKLACSRLAHSVRPSEAAERMPSPWPSRRRGRSDQPGMSRRSPLARLHPKFIALGSVGRGAAPFPCSLLAASPGHLLRMVVERHPKKCETAAGAVRAKVNDVGNLSGRAASNPHRSNGGFPWEE